MASALVPEVHVRIEQVLVQRLGWRGWVHGRTAQGDVPVDEGVAEPEGAGADGVDDGGVNFRVVRVLVLAALWGRHYEVKSTIFLLCKLLCRLEDKRTIS